MELMCIPLTGDSMSKSPTSHSTTEFVLGFRTGSLSNYRALIRKVNRGMAGWSVLRYLWLIKLVTIL